MPDGFFCFFSKSQLDLLGCFGDLGQQSHELGLVHPAAVVGKGVEAPCTQNERTMPRRGSAVNVGSSSATRLRRPCSMLLANTPWRLPEKRMLTARWFCTKARNSPWVSSSVWSSGRFGPKSVTQARMLPMTLVSNPLERA